MIKTDQWLPIGSVVHLKDQPSLAFVAGCMQVDAEDGRLWDYLGYPYPLGNYGETAGMVFDKDSIDCVYFVGYQDVDGLRYQDLLDGMNAEFVAKKAEAAAAAEETAAGEQAATGRLA